MPAHLPLYAFRRLKSPHSLNAALLAVILLLPFFSVLLAAHGRVLGNVHLDNPSFFYYFNEYAGSSWRAGEPPFWNPYIMFGIPFLAEGQAALFHPLSLLFVPLSAGAAINWLIAICFVLNGLAFWGYLRSLDLGIIPATAGALTWSFSSVPISSIYAGHLNRLLGYFTLPLLLMLWELYRRRGQPRWLALFALTYASLNLAGFPQLTFLFSLFLICYVTFPLLLGSVPQPGRRREWSLALRLAGFAVLGAALAAVQLAPAAAAVPGTYRQAASFEFCSSFSFAPENLVTLLCPLFFGPVDIAEVKQYWGRNLLWEMWLYIGILPLALAAAGAVFAPRRLRRTLLAAAGGFALLALGSHTPFFRVVYALIPAYRLFRGPSKHIYLAAFCLCTLSAYGWSWLLEARQSGKDRAFRAALIWILILLGVILALAAFFLPHYQQPGSPWESLIKWVRAQKEGQPWLLDPASPLALPETGALAARQMARAFALLSGALLALLVCRRLALRRAGIGFAFALLAADWISFIPPFLTTYDEAQVRYPEAFLKPMQQMVYPARYYDFDAPPNMAMLHHLSSIAGYSGNALRRYNDFMNVTQGLGRDSLQASTVIRRFPSLYQILAIDYTIAARPMVRPDMRVVAEQDERCLVAMDGSYPRVFLAQGAQRVRTPEAALETVLKSRTSLRQQPVIETGAPLPPPGPLSAEESAEIVAFGRNRVELRVRTKQPRHVVLNEMVDQNWRASVNGAEAQIFPANYLFRAVLAPEGESAIIFRFWPGGLGFGLAVSLLAAAALAGLIMKSPRFLVPEETPLTHSDRKRRK